MITDTDFDCPFCGGNVGVGTTEAGVLCIGHTQPGCEDFIRMDADDYMAAVRRKLGIPAPDCN